MTALGSFSAPYVFGGGFRVMPTQIVATRLNGEDQLAMVQTASLSAMALLALLLFRSDPREAVGGGGQKGRGDRHGSPSGGRSRGCSRGSRDGGSRRCCCCRT